MIQLLERCLLPLGCEKGTLELLHRRGVIRRLTQFRQLGGVAARYEHEAVVVARQRFADRPKQSIGGERGEAPLAVRMTAFHLMEHPPSPDRYDEFRLLDTGGFNADRVRIAMK